MERLEYDGYGGPELVRIRSFRLAVPKADEIVVRVAAASINPLDWKIRAGVLKVMTGWKFPRAMGTDFAGTVEAVGAKVTDLKPGDPVVGTVPLKSSGAFASMLVTKWNLVVRKPDALSFSQAASLPIAGVTAWQALVKIAHLKPGQKVLINGATGAVGQAAIRIARDIGAVVVGRISPKSLAQAEALGLDLALDYTVPLTASLDRSFDVVLDANGSLTMKDGDRLIKPGGVVIDIVPVPLKILKALVSRARTVIFADVKAANLQQVIDLAAAGKLAIPIARTISLADAPALLASLEQGRRLHGKAVITF